jgi:hypothetical protein
MSAAPLQFLLLVFAGWVNRGQREILECLQEENRVLREQLGGRRLRFNEAQRRRLAAKGSMLGRRVLDQLGGLVTPDTILRWYRELIAKKYDGTARRGCGRSGTAASLHCLVIQLATENPSWSYTRLRGALRNLGHELGRNTIKRILADHGIAPAPKRGKTMPWKTFLKAHFGVIAATDFFTVEVLTFSGLVRYLVLFVIDLETRRVHIAGLVRHPHGAWIQQVARNLTDDVDGFLNGKRYLIHDRDRCSPRRSARSSAPQASSASSSPHSAPTSTHSRSASCSPSSPSASASSFRWASATSALRPRSSSSTTISSATTKAWTTG